MRLESQKRAVFWRLLTLFSYSELFLPRNGIFTIFPCLDSKPRDFPSLWSLGHPAKTRIPLAYEHFSVCLLWFSHSFKQNGNKKCENRVRVGTVSLPVDGGDSNNMANKHKIVFLPFFQPQIAWFFAIFQCVFAPIQIVCRLLVNLVVFHFSCPRVFCRFLFHSAAREIQKSNSVEIN